MATTIPTYVQSYVYSNSVWGILRDSTLYNAKHQSTAWEEFTEKDLPPYLKSCAEIFTTHFSDSLNLNEVFTEEHEKQLIFMLESFVHVRKLLS